MLQLDPPLWFETPKGIGLAHFVERVSMEHSLYWTIFDEATGECWTWPNEKVRAIKNITLDRVNPQKPKAEKLPRADRSVQGL